MQNVIQENPSVWKLNVIDAHEVPAVYWPMRTCVLRLFNGAVVGQIIYCVSLVLGEQVNSLKWNTTRTK